MPLAVLSPRGTGHWDWRCALSAQGLPFGSSRHVRQLVLSLVAGRRRVRRAIYRQTREDFVARRRVDRQDREKGGERGRAKIRCQI